MQTQTNDLAIENDNLREDIAARDALINVLQRRLRHTRVNLVLAASLIAGQTSRVAHLQCEADDDARAIGTLTRELAEERIWSSYYQDISDSLAGELQRIDDMLAGVGYEANGDESIADRVALLIKDTMPRTWAAGEDHVIWPQFIRSDNGTCKEG